MFVLDTVILQQRSVPGYVLYLPLISGPQMLYNQPKYYYSHISYSDILRRTVRFTFEPETHTAVT
jgi:hypothetical protein